MNVDSFENNTFHKSYKQYNNTRTINTYLVYTTTQSKNPAQKPGINSEDTNRDPSVVVTSQEPDDMYGDLWRPRRAKVPVADCSLRIVRSALQQSIIQQSPIVRFFVVFLPSRSTPRSFS